MSEANPCLTCGACCAFFRASFYWGETTDAKVDGVPAGLTEPVTPFRVAMRGTNQKEPRCIALAGEIGRCVSCTIHRVRASVCRDFPASYSDGQVNVDCDRARAKFGLRPLTLADWLAPVPGPGASPDAPPDAPDTTPTEPRPRAA